MKGSKKLTPTVFIILALLVIPSPGVAASGQLSSYIQKYRQVTLHDSVHQRLSDYDEMIEYFTSLHYFVPRHRVNADFLRALIIAESSVDQRATSPKDARGLTQIIYETGQRAARELIGRQFPFRYVNMAKLKNLHPQDLYDPAINILIASFLISKYNHKYDGRLDLVVAAWNAGEGAIRNNQPPPYRETLDLIGKVNGYYLALLKSNSYLVSTVRKNR